VPNTLLVLDAGFGDAGPEREAAEPQGATVVDLASSAPEDLPPPESVDGLLVRYGRIDAEVMDRYPNLRVIGRYGIGVDNVAIDEATRRRIGVVNVPDYCVEEVATHTAALVLATWRRLADARALVSSRRWDEWEALRPVRRLSEASLGLVGLGRIGLEVARLLGPFFGSVLAFDPVAQPTERVRLVSLDEVFADADVVSLHCPLTTETRHVADANRLASMKPGSILVNVSRGALVDTTALPAAIAAGRPAIAALDVLPTEPPATEEPLLDMPNLFLTNHVAWYSETALLELRRLTAARAATFLRGADVPSLVNRDGLAAEGEAS
jgi:D-3-phosphoglycerate dehydrogenase